jgi:hypothetical protein
MASKFFQKPQLGQSQLTNAQQSNLPDNDAKAEMKAQRAAQSIDSLSGMAQKVVSTVTGKYLENVDAKNRLASGQQRPNFIAHVDAEIAKTENFESLGSEGLADKYREFSQSFAEQHKDKPYASQLKSDMEQMGERMLGNMMKKRDSMHTQIVFDSTAEGSSNAMQMYSEGLIDANQLQGRLAELSYDSTLAFQVPSSSGLDMDDDSRGRYQGLTREQSNEAILRGVMIQTGQPNNSKVAEMLDNPVFRAELGISPTDKDYNKLVAIAYDKGARADKVNYESGLDSFKESLYTKTNQGFTVDMDAELQLFTDSGQQITAQDEYKIRKAFKLENRTNTTSRQYRDNLLDGKDISAGLSRKDKQSIFERSFTDVLGLNDDGITIESVSSALSDRAGQVGFSDYIKSGGKVPDKFVQMFDVPAGSSAEKWSRASQALVSMQAAASGSGQSIEEIIGVKQVTKIRGMSRIYNDPDMEGAVKQNAIDALQTQSTSFNSKGYLKGTSEQPIDTEWLSDVSKDASWTTDDYVSDQQNAEEIAGNYHAYRMAGNSEGDAQELALNLFNKSNRSLEMSNGGEIVIPVKHKNLNNISIDEFSKSLDKDGNPRFPSLKAQREDLEVSTGQGWISEWRARTNISFQKSYNYGKTGTYDMLYDGKLVERATFSYDELEDFIANSTSREREKMIGGKHRSIQEVEEDALSNRRKNIERQQNQGSLEQHLFDLEI